MFSARAGQAESVLAYAAVADLLGDVDPAVLAGLPDLQRIAVDRVLLRASSEGPATDQGVVAAAFASVVDRLAVDAPVVVAIDDVQWLDPSSEAVVAFAARRVNGRVGVLVTERCDPDCGNVVKWLHLASPTASTGSRRSAEPGWPARTDLFAAGPIVSPPDDGADIRDFRRQPVLRTRVGTRDRRRVGRLSSGAARNVVRAYASADRAPGPRRPHSAAGRGVGRQPDRRAAC